MNMVLGVTQDNSEAIKWYRKAAEQGDATAQIVLGICYQQGKIVNENYNAAIYWFKKAADQGREDAKEMLYGMAYHPSFEYKDEETSGHSNIDGCIIHILSFLAVIGLISWLISFLIH